MPESEGSAGGMPFVLLATEPWTISRLSVMNMGLSFVSWSLARVEWCDTGQPRMLLTRTRRLRMQAGDPRKASADNGFLGMMIRSMISRGAKPVDRLALMVQRAFHIRCLPEASKTTVFLFVLTYRNACQAGP